MALPLPASRCRTVMQIVIAIGYRATSNGSFAVTSVADPALRSVAETAQTSVTAVWPVQGRSRSLDIQGLREVAMQS